MQRVPRWPTTALSQWAVLFCLLSPGASALTPPRNATNTTAGRSIVTLGDDALTGDADFPLNVMVPLRTYRD